MRGSKGIKGFPEVQMLVVGIFERHSTALATELDKDYDMIAKRERTGELGQSKRSEGQARATNPKSAFLCALINQKNKEVRADEDTTAVFYQAAATPSCR